MFPQSIPVCLRNHDHLYCIGCATFCIVRRRFLTDQHARCNVAGSTENPKYIHGIETDIEGHGDFLIRSALIHDNDVHRIQGVIHAAVLVVGGKLDVHRSLQNGGFRSIMIMEVIGSIENTLLVAPKVIGFQRLGIDPASIPDIGDGALVLAARFEQTLDLADEAFAALYSIGLAEILHPFLVDGLCSTFGLKLLGKTIRLLSGWFL